MAVRSQQQDIEAKKLGRVICVGGRLREELAGSRHDGRSGVGVTEIVDVGPLETGVRPRIAGSGLGQVPTSLNLW